ncbi:hypothetical protein BD626DRAFT_508527, partial [Schizophyllum amplum]
MHQIQYLSRVTAPPCEYFDIIAGSGTGGLIALLLGRLRLSVDQAIECYTRVVQRVFLRTESDGTFKVSSLNDTGDDTVLLDDSVFHCKTFVCVRQSTLDSARAHARRLRTYPAPGYTSRHTFTEAVRATMGHRTFFRPDDPAAAAASRIFDAGDDHYNPILDLCEEARSLFPSRHIVYLLSLGAGQSTTIDVSPPKGFFSQPILPLPILSAVRHIAERCESTDAKFRQMFGDFDRTYFRLSLDRGIDNGKPTRWEQEAALQEATNTYIVAVHDTVLTLATRMMHEINRASARTRRNR